MPDILMNLFSWAMTIVFTLCLMVVVIGTIIAFAAAVGWMVRKLVNTFRKPKKNYIFNKILKVY